MSNVKKIILARQELAPYLQSTIFISQGYHLARVKILARRFGFSGLTYPAGGKPLKKKNLFMMREIFAYLYTIFFEWPESQ
jgi:uncharacterized SAM-binding protein YcdF (DUF218 family)